MYGLAFVVLGGFTLLMRVVGCLLYVLTRAWMYSPLVPASLRRCQCCRSAPAGFVPRTPGRPLQSPSGPASPFGFQTDGGPIYSNPMRSGDPLSPRAGGFPVSSPQGSARPSSGGRGGRGETPAVATQVLATAQLSRTVDGSPAAATVANLSSAFSAVGAASGGGASGNPSFSGPTGVEQI